MSPRHRLRSFPFPRAKTRPGLTLYLCCVAEVVFGFSGAVGSMPWTRLVESVICQRQASSTNTGVMVTKSGIRPSLDSTLLSMLLIGGKGGSTAEARCKGDMVQAAMAEL